MSKLVLLALLSDLMTPMLITKAGFPAETRYLSSAVLVLVLVDGYALIVRGHRVPGVLWLVGVASVVGIARALLGGQSMGATLWGWWLMFRYPLVGLHAYLSTPPGGRSQTRILRWTVILLGFEAAVQVVQYLTGQAPGDQLGGTLGENGTGTLALIVLLVFALALGDWIANGRVRTLLLAAAFGFVSSILGEMKIFFFAAGAMAAISLGIHLLRTRRAGQLVPFSVLLAVALVAFPSVYDSVVPGADKRPFLQYLDTEVLSQYTTFVQAESNANFELGRFYALTYAWEEISHSYVSMSIGDGLGARGESKTLGTVGTTLATGRLGVTIGGGSIAVVLGEMGVIGIVVLAGFVAWVSRSLWRGASYWSRRDPDTAALHYGLFVFSLLWPIWLWYNPAWTLPVPMLLYWSTLGYCLACSRKGMARRRVAIPPAIGSRQSTSATRALLEGGGWSRWSA